MPVPRSSRALSLLVAVAALAACHGNTSPEDPAVAVGTTIPLGATSALGVTFASPIARRDLSEPGDSASDDKPKPLPSALPPDPFDPPHAAPPRMAAPKRRGTAL